MPVGYNLLFQHMHVTCIDRIIVFHVLIASTMYHCFVVTSFKKPLFFYGRHFIQQLRHELRLLHAAPEYRGPVPSSRLCLQLPAIADSGRQQ